MLTNEQNGSDLASNPAQIKVNAQIYFPVKSGNEQHQ